MNDRLGRADKHEAGRDDMKSCQGARPGRTHRKREENDDGNRDDDNQPELREGRDATQEAPCGEHERGPEGEEPS